MYKRQEEETTQEEQIFAGMNFVITGSVEHFANRNEVKEVIESKGGKVTGSVTSKTNWLINNDVESTSSKNKKARELGIPIISEDTFLKMIEMCIRDRDNCSENGEDGDKKRCGSDQETGAGRYFTDRGEDIGVGEK